MAENIEKSITTKVVHGCQSFDSLTGAVSVPIYQSATFRHPALYESTGYDYSRLQNPTREALEKTIARLENAQHGLAFSTGMAAISTVIKLFKTGDHLIVSDDLYGGTYRLFQEIYQGYGLKFSYVDTSKINDIESAMTKDTKAFFIETPSNPTMKITDLEAVNLLAKKSGIMVIVDNTFLTPYFQRPLELGADIVVHSGTKFLGGHNDTLAGLIALNSDEWAERLRLIQKSEGAVLAPFDSWLIIRGIKTLSVRLERQQENAMIISAWLAVQPEVEKVYYAGLEDSQGYDIMKRQASGFGSMISFSVKQVDTVERLLKKVKLILFAESLGGVETLMTYPIVQTHAAIPADIRERVGVDEKLLRLSVGIEDVWDIIRDLEQAFKIDEEISELGRV